MTSLVHHVPRLGLDSAPRAGRDLVVVGAGERLRVTLVALAVVACLVAGAILTVAAFASIDTQGRIPYPVPLPAPTGRSLAGN